MSNGQNKDSEKIVINVINETHSLKYLLKDGSLFDLSEWSTSDPRSIIDSCDYKKINIEIVNKNDTLSLNFKDYKVVSWGDEDNIYFGVYISQYDLTIYLYSIYFEKNAGFLSADDVSYPYVYLDGEELFLTGKFKLNDTSLLENVTSWIKEMKTHDIDTEINKINGKIIESLAVLKGNQYDKILHVERNVILKIGNDKNNKHLDIIRDALDNKFNIYSVYTDDTYPTRLVSDIGADKNIVYSERIGSNGYKMLSIHDIQNDINIRSLL